VDFHKRHNAIATIASHVRKVRIDYGVIQPNENSEITGYIEKPSFDYCVSMGIYVFEPRILDYIPYKEYLDLPDLVLKLLAANEHVMSFPYEDYWMDLGRISDYEQAVKDFDVIGPQILGDEYCPSEEMDFGQPVSNHNL
jgi:NDP-mannose synthase